MWDPSDSVPAYQAIRIGALESPVAQLADTEAWLARERYPDLVSPAEPAFFVTREREAGGWEIVKPHANDTPQDARDSLGSHFRELAHDAGQAGHQVAYRECVKAYERMDWEAIDELTVLGDRYRVVRAEFFIRTGPAGPEPPRPSDPNLGEPDESDKLPDPAEGFVIDPTTPSGISEGIFKSELLRAEPGPRSSPEGRRDARRAQRTHPGCALLPPAFLIAARADKKWGSVWTRTWSQPQQARDHLANHFRIRPWNEDRDAETQARHREIADRYSDERADSLTVDGQRYRIVRVERFVRIGPDGPEGPRPSDPDPHLPAELHSKQLRDQGLLKDDEEEDPQESAALDEEDDRILRLLKEERERRQERIARRRARRTRPQPPS